jgi:F0F1-type ATP synthase delta subunit
MRIYKYNKSFKDIKKYNDFYNYHNFDNQIDIITCEFFNFFHYKNITLEQAIFIINGMDLEQDIIDNENLIQYMLDDEKGKLLKELFSNNITINTQDFLNWALENEFLKILRNARKKPMNILNDFELIQPKITTKDKDLPNKIYNEFLKKLDKYRYKNKEIQITNWLNELIFHNEMIAKVGSEIFEPNHTIEQLKEILTKNYRPNYTKVNIFKSVQITFNQALMILLGLNPYLVPKENEKNKIFIYDGCPTTHHILIIDFETSLQTTEQYQNLEQNFDTNKIDTKEFINWAVDNGFLKEVELPDFPIQGSTERKKIINNIMDKITLQNPKLSQNKASKKGLEEIEKSYKVKKLSFEAIKSNYYKK